MSGGGYRAARAVEAALRPPRQEPLVRRGDGPLSGPHGPARPLDLGAGRLPRGSRRLPGVGSELVRGRGLRGVRREEPADAAPLVPGGRPLALLGHPAVQQLRRRGPEAGGAAAEPHQLRQPTTWRATCASGCGTRTGIAATRSAGRGATRPTSTPGPTPSIRWTAARSWVCAAPSTRPRPRRPPSPKSRTSCAISRRSARSTTPPFASTAGSSTTTPSTSARRWSRWTTGPSTGARRGSASPRPTAASASPRGSSCRRTRAPPFQTVVYFPPGERRSPCPRSTAWEAATSASWCGAGARCCFPVYQQTYERRRPVPDGPNYVPRGRHPARPGRAPRHRLPGEPAGRRPRAHRLLRPQHGGGRGRDRRRRGAPAAHPRPRGGGPRRRVASRGGRAQLRAPRARPRADGQRPVRLHRRPSRRASSRSSACWDRRRRTRSTWSSTAATCPRGPTSCARRSTGWTATLGPVTSDPPGPTGRFAHGSTSWTHSGERTGGREGARRTAPSMSSVERSRSRKVTCAGWSRKRARSIATNFASSTSFWSPRGAASSGAGPAKPWMRLRLRARSTLPIEWSGPASTPVSSRVSRRAAVSTSSPGFVRPFGMLHGRAAVVGAPGVHDQHLELPVVAPVEKRPRGLDHRPVLRDSLSSYIRLSARRMSASLVVASAG